MHNFKIMLQNPTTNQVGSVTITSWSEEDAKFQAKSRLSSMGFTKIMRCIAA